jgi:hypothetical protein
MLFMLFDLGLSVVGPRTRRVQVMRSLVADGLPSPSRCAVWAIHARGHDAGVSGCVTALDTNLAVRQFWAALAPSDPNAGYRNDPKKTVRFRRVAESYRHGLGDATEEQPAADDDDSD